MSQNLFRNSDGSIRNILDNVEGISNEKLVQIS